MKVAENDLPPVLGHIPDGKINTVCTHDCPDACNIELTIKNGFIRNMTGDPNHEFTNGYLCKKTPAELVKTLNNNPNRLLHPLLKTTTGFKKIEWEEAFNLIVEKIKEYKNQYGPLSILHYHGAGSFGGLKRTFVRRFFSLLGGTSTISGSICDTASMEAQIKDFGEQRTHVPHDLLNSKFVMVWGRNPANTGPHFMQYLRKLKKTGTDILLIDPIKTRTFGACTEYHRVHPGSDRFLALAMGNIIVKNGLVDTDFIQQHTVGFEDYKKLVLSIDLTQASEQCGIDLKTIESITMRYVQNKPASIWMGFGLQRYVHGGATVRLIDALGAITGNISKSGGGVSHQNCEVEKYFDYNLNMEDTITRKRFLRKAVIAGDLEKATDPPVKMIFVNGVNPVSQCANSRRVSKAFENTGFVVCIDAFMTDTAQSSNLVLPTTRLLEEEDVTWSYAGHHMGLAKRILPAPNGVKSDFEIYQTLSEKLGFGDQMQGSSKEWINRTLGPVACHEIDYDRLDKEIMVNPNLSPIAFHDHKFTTPSGKFSFIRNVDASVTPLSERYPYHLLSVHHHFWLNSNIYDKSQEEKIGSAPFAYLHPDISAKENLQEGDEAIVYSSIGEMNVCIKISDNYSSRSITIYQGGNLQKGTCVNSITDDLLISDFGEMAAYYSTCVNIRKR